MKRKLIPLLLLPVLTLSACSNELRVEPSQIKDDNVLVKFFEDGKEVNVDIYNNLNSIIYDAKLDNGTVAKDVLNDVLLELAKSVYGDFATLKELSGKTAKDDAVLKFINKHKAYQSIDKDEKRIANDEANEFKRLTLTYERIGERIANKFFSAIKGSFTRDGLFYEEDYIMSLRNSLKNVKKPDGDATKGYLIPPEFDEKNVFNEILHEKYYVDYINEDIIPEIYRELLVEQYLFDSNYSTIARAYAREVEIITINNRADDSNAAKDLLNAYVDTYINTDKKFTNEPSFDIIATAWRGYDLPETGKIDGTVKEQAAWLLHDVMGLDKVEFKAEGTVVTDGIADYYPGTSYGSLVKNLEKIKLDSKKTDTSIENEFTNNGEYTVERGFRAKEIKVQQETYITDGWHIRNGGLSSVNESIRARLFNIGVANALDKENNEAEKQYPDRIVNGEVNLDVEENPYVAKINGRYFLKPSSVTEKNDARDMIFYDDSADAYTIVEIKNAVSSSKLARNSKDNYIHLDANKDEAKGFEKMETIAHAVAYEVAKGESYRSLSTKHWLEAAAIAYHDDKILEYFETNYPELFEDK